MSPFSSAPSCTALPHSTFSTSTSRRRHLRPYTQTSSSTTHAQNSRTPSARIRSCLLASSRPSSQRSSSHHGLSSLVWCVYHSFNLHVSVSLMIMRVAHSGALLSRAHRTFYRRASCLSCSLSFSLRAYCFGIGLNSVSARFFCMVRALLHSLSLLVSRRSWASLRAGLVAASKNVT
jgi:hypothetical protein